MILAAEKPETETSARERVWSCTQSRKSCKPWFPYNRKDRSDRCDHMETRLKSELFLRRQVGQVLIKHYMYKTLLEASRVQTSLAAPRL